MVRTVTTLDVRGQDARRSPVVPVVLTAFVVLGAALLAVGADSMVAGVVMLLVITVAALGVAGWAVRRTRLERAAHETSLKTRAAAEAVVAERLRIARDLHDIVSHGLGLITVRAAAGRRSADRAPQEALEALSDIETVSREATTELRRMLTVLRDAEAVPAPLRPAEGLDGLPELLRGAQAAGLRTELVVEPLGQVSAGVQAALARVVQESIANVVRHAGPSDVRVRVHREGGTVVLTVSDTGPDREHRAVRSVPGAGLGLVGLRERVAAFGGMFEAGPEGNGFRVTARLPDSDASGGRP